MTTSVTPITPVIPITPAPYQPLPLGSGHQAPSDPTAPDAQSAPCIVQPLAAPKPCDEGGSTPNPQPAPRRRNGKIAHLPKTVRDQLNQMLLDGVPYSQIIAELEPQAPGLNKVNLTNWKNGGYQDWLRDQRLVDDSRLRYELALDLARDSQGIDVFKAAHKVAAALICDAVAQVGSAAFKDAIRKDPHNLLRMLNSLSHLTNGGLKCELQSLEQAEREAELKKQANPKKPGLSAETRRLIEAELNLL